MLLHKCNDVYYIIKMDDEYYLNFLNDTKYLSERTKEMYKYRLSRIKQDIMKKSLDYILHHPVLFDSKLRQFGQDEKGRTGDCLGHHTLDAYYSAVMSLFTYNQELKESDSELYLTWKSQHKKIKDPINIKYKSNEPTQRQMEAYVPYSTIVKTCDNLPSGSMSKLLIMMYTEIPPVRSDYWRTRIVSTIDEADGDPDSNFLILGSRNSKVVLKKYKTSKKYGVIYIDTTSKLHGEIINSLLNNPRDYLFVSSTGLPYDLENSFNKWANRQLKSLFGAKFNLTMLRHIYISRRDLNLEEKSGLEQEEIANLMGHSIEQQRRYSWHSWLRKS